MKFKFLLLVAGFGAAFFHAANGEPTAVLQWGSDAFASNRDSKAATITSDYVFEIGTFGADFEAQDPATWAASWEAVDRTVFQAEGGFFQETTLLNSSNLPTDLNAQPCIWGYRTSGGVGEWILLTNPAWTWPSLSSLSFPAPSRLLIRDATIAYAGTVDPNSGAWTTSEADQGTPSLSWAAWKDLHFAPNEDSSPEIDSDQDGLNNYLEYFLGTDPHSPSSQKSLEVCVEGSAQGPKLCLTVNRSPAAGDVDATIFSTQDFEAWSPAESNFTLRGQTPYQIEYEQTLTQPTKEFFQLRLQASE